MFLWKHQILLDTEVEKVQDTEVKEVQKQRLRNYKTDLIK